MRDIRAATVQLEPVMGDKAANLAQIETWVKEAARRGAQIIAFPECCLTGYWHLRRRSREELAALAEPVPGGPACGALMQLARRHGVTIGAGLVERGEDGWFHNTYFVAMPDGRHARHRKIHAFESDFIQPGNEFTVFDAPFGWKVGVLICYDCNICENVRITALKGADLLLAPHQTGGCDSPDPNIMGLVDRRLWENRHADPAAIEEELRGPKGRAWLMRWLPARAHDNGIFLLFSNGIGEDDGEVRTGNAMILDPYGRIIAETWRAGDDMVIADLDASLLENATGRRWIRTRRPELYAPLTVPTGLEQDTRAVRFDKKGI